MIANTSPVTLATEAVRTFACRSAIPSHSYVEFDGRAGSATVSRDLSMIVWHNPRGGDYRLPTLEKLRSVLSQKGMNHRNASETIREITDWTEAES